MSPKLTGTAQRRVLALVPAVLVLLVGALAYDRARSVVSDVQEVGRSHGIVEGSDALLARAVDAETGQRAYLLTGNETFLEPYLGARADIERSLDSLRVLVRDGPAQQTRLAAISRLVPERFALLDTAITLRRQGATSSDRLLAGKKKMDQLRSLVADLKAHEQGRLAERGLAEQRGVRNASLAVGAAGILALLISVLVNLAFSRALMERDNANVALRTVNEDLEHQSEELEEQAVEMESQAAELEATAEDLRTTNDALSRTTRAAEKARDFAEDARHRLERVLDNLPEAASVFDSGWRWTYVNPSAARILVALGVDPSQAIGQVLWDTLPALRGTRFEAETLRALRESTVVDYEEYIPALDAWMENSIVPLSGAVMTFSRDITRRKREQQGARLLADASRVLASTLDYEKTLETVARLAVGGLADWCSVELADPEGKVRQVVVSHRDEAKIKWAKELNKRYPPDHSGPTGVGQVIRTGRAELYHEISDAMLIAAARDADHLAIMRELQIKSALIVPMIARGRTLGALTLISSDSGRRYDEADQTLATEVATRAAIAIDNAQLYRSALAASESKSAFLATMSHELRTPLNAIIGYQSLLEEGINGSLNEAQRVQLTRIRASADHLLGLIDEVLTFSRVDAGKEVVRREQVQLAPIIAEALTMVTPLAESKGLRLRDETVDAALLIDGGKVRQILLNLLSNAIKFSDDGEIVVRLRLDPDSVAISIVDPGIGMSAENIARIFDPFWQVEQRSTRRVGGSGLGLSVSRSLARLLGGDVSVESEVERGSMFTLTLPTRRGGSS